MSAVVQGQLQSGNASLKQEVWENSINSYRNIAGCGGGYISNDGGVLTALHCFLTINRLYSVVLHDLCDPIVEINEVYTLCRTKNRDVVEFAIYKVASINSLLESNENKDDTSKITLTRKKQVYQSILDIYRTSLHQTSLIWVLA